MQPFTWLIMPVEVKHREFLSRIILAAAAVNRGYRVLLGKDTMIRRLAPALPKGIIFDKSLGTARHGKPQRFNKLGHHVVVLDEESTGYYGSPEQFLSVRLAHETLNACRRWYCISDELKNHATELYPDHAEKFVTTGLLRTDSWRENFHSFYEDDRKRIEAEIGPFILFDSNFGGLIHARGDAFVQKQIRGQKEAYSDVEERMAKIFEQGRPNLEAFIDVLPKVADWFPKHRIVIRPHPSETVAFWEDLFKSDERLIVSNEGVATPWILASSMMFHHGCTTGIEASILGKPNVMFAPFPDEHHDTPVMESFVPIVKDEKALKASINEALRGNLKSQNNRDKWEAYYSNLQGRLAADVILDDLEDLAFSSTEISERLPISVKLRIAMANRKARSSREKAYMKQKWPGTSINEIDDALNKAASGLKLDAGFRVQEVFDEVYEISAL